MKFLNKLLNASYQIKRTLQKRYFGFYYRCRGIISISDLQRIETNIDFKLVSAGYFIHGYENLGLELLKETNLEMKPFWYVSLPGGRLLTDLGCNLAIFDSGNFIVTDITFSYIKRVNGLFYHGRAEENYFYRTKKIEKPKHIEGVVFSLLTGGGKNFNIYHWFFDSLSRLYAIKDELATIDYFLVPEYVQEYQIESLRFFGIDHDRVISSIENKHLIAKELKCTTHPRTATYSVRKELTNFLRDKFTYFNENIITKDKYYPTLFYISRKDAPRRKVDNEEELIFELKKKGIAALEISDYSFIEIIYIFKKASLILSTHSAALTNILFCNKSAKIVEYFPNMGVLPYYKDLSESLNLEYHEIVDRVTLSTDIQSRYDLQKEEFINININLLLNELNIINENRNS